MCIIIFKPEEKDIPFSHLEFAFENNSHGAGFMAWDSDENKLIVKKGFFDLTEFLEEYEAYRHLRCVLHFRVSTGGKHNEANCHPFSVDENLAFVHNGSIKIARPKQEFSDTWHFNESLKAVKDMWHTSRFKEPLSRILHLLGHSKLVFMDNFGNYHIHNENAGNWKDGIWYSNYSYSYSKAASYYGHYYGYDEWSFMEEEYIKQKEKEKANKHLSTCVICDDDFLNQYKYWSVEEETWVCSSCFRLEEIHQEITTTSRRRASSQSSICDICQERDLNVTFCVQMGGKWSCEDCEAQFELLNEEERKLFLSNATVA